MHSLFRYFSAPEHAEAFVRRGEMLFRSLSYFRDYEDAAVRSDEYEGTLVHRPKSGLKLLRVGNGEEISVPHQFEASAREDEIFVYCLTTAFDPTVAERFEASVCVEIMGASTLLARVRRALARRPHIHNKMLVHGEVIYYESHDPPIVDWALPERIAMRKPRSLSWQREYRIAFSLGDAFTVQNVAVKLVIPGARKAAMRSAHPQRILKIGNLSGLCRMHSI